MSLKFRGGSGKVHDETELRAYLEDGGFRVERFMPGSLSRATAAKH